MRRALPLALAVGLAVSGCDAEPVAPDDVARIEVVAGDLQTGLTGVSLPDSVVVRVTDSADRPLAGRTVAWQVTAGDGSVGVTSATDDAGLARALWTLGDDTGGHALRATVGGRAVVASATAEIATPGTLYAGRRGYVEYHPGTLPIIISAPHGGTNQPSEIPDRTEGTFVRDTNTTELALAIADAFEARTGLRPHVIALRLHRRKLDANREPIEAAQGNALALQTWSEFHGFIEHAKTRAAEDFGLGFYIDLHGHGHAVQRLELGYLLTGGELSLPDAQLDSPTLRARSSIRVLAEHSAAGFVPLLRGPIALGTLFEHEGVPAVPSAQQPDPGGEPYFSGGYNTDRHSVWSSGLTAGVQIEAHFGGIRDNATSRARFGEAVAAVIEAYFVAHYGIDLEALATLAVRAAATAAVTAAMP